jgi:transposase InsO family protein
MYRGGDIQKFASKLPGLPWSKYSGEKHLFNHSFTGPGTRLDLRLDEHDQPNPGEYPKNRVDRAALKHDIFYRDHSDINERHLADQHMIEELKSIPNPTFRERVERAIVIKVLQAKMKLGLGLADELHHEFRNSKHLLKVKVFAKDDIWSADLVEMPKQGRFRYILTVIDLYTKFAWGVPLTNKTGKLVAEAFQKIMNESNRKPNKLWVDQGKEFYNKEMKKFAFTLYSTNNEGKAVVIERFNRTLKQMMFKIFTERGSQNWLHLLPDVLKRYNNKVHSTIRTTPQIASDNPEKISRIMYKNNFENEMHLKRKKRKFKVGARVRMFKWKSHFEKGYTAKWTREIFIVKKVNSTVPVTYELEDEEGEEIIGRFYEHELQHTDF